MWGRQNLSGLWFFEHLNRFASVSMCAREIARVSTQGLKFHIEIFEFEIYIIYGFWLQ